MGVFRVQVDAVATGSQVRVEHKPSYLLTLFPILSLVIVLLYAVVETMRGNWHYAVSFAVGFLLFNILYATCAVFAIRSERREFRSFLFRLFPAATDCTYQNH
jgi:hypothetical protein